MKGFRNFSRLRTRAPGSLGTSLLSNRQHSATAACKAPISSLPPVRLASIAVRCRALTMPKWTLRFFKGHPGNPILSVIWVTEIRANFAPGLRDSISTKRAKFCNLGGDHAVLFGSFVVVSSHRIGFEFCGLFYNEGRIRVPSLRLVVKLTSHEKAQHPQPARRKGQGHRARAGGFGGRCQNGRRHACLHYHLAVREGHETEKE